MNNSFKHRSWRLFSTFALTLLTSTSSIAATINVLPVRIYMSSQKPITSIKVENKSANKIMVQSETVVWTQRDNKPLLRPTGDVIVSPPIFELDAGASQVVRIAVQNDSSPDVEKTYRIFLTEVKLEKEGDAKPNGVQVALRLSLPIFVTPAGSKADFVWTLQQSCETPKKQALVVNNQGARHAMLLKINLKHAGSSSYIEQIYRPSYVLSGSQISWPLETALLEEGGKFILDYENIDGTKGSTPLSIQADACQAAPSV